MEPFAMDTRTDLSDLANLAQACLHLALDGRVDAAQRLRLLDLGEHLTERVQRLAVRRFDARTEAFQHADADLRALNARAKAALDDLSKLTDALDVASKVVEAADKLLALAL
jgi:hypothetical protein